MRDRIDLEAVSFAWGAAPPVLCGVDLTVRKGEIVIICGRSGSGKSSLLELCAGLIRPTAGRVLWDGTDCASMTKEDLLRARQSIGYMFQVHALIANFTVFDNCALPLRTRGGMSADTIAKRVRTEMDNLMLSSGIDNRYPEALSVYECKAVALCRALIGDPELLILDEPLAGLDAAAIKRFCSVIEQRWQERAMAVIMTNQDLSVLPHLTARRMVLDNRTVAPCRDAVRGGA
jgi:ABC-type transporter Mla maintaining outer membrane lipid asymmetry ATPase subunit MlaF